MDKLVIEGLSDAQNSQLNRIYRKLKRDSETAQAAVAEFAAKMTEGLHPLNTLSWSESTFKYAAIFEVNRPFIVSIENALKDLENASRGEQGARAEVVARFADFVDNFEDTIKTRVAMSMSNKAFGTMQTGNLAEHYKTVATAALLELYY